MSLEKSIKFDIEFQDITHSCDLNSIEIFVQKFIIRISSNEFHLIQTFE